MRPIRRNISPQKAEYRDYKKAQLDLVSRLGLYCSYCERRIATNLAVEHIQPQDGPNGRPELTGRWTNFLLSCVNCNSTKGCKKVELEKLLLPDRDNTGAAYNYTADGKIQVSSYLNASQKILAKNTLGLVGLDKPANDTLDANGQQVALDRESQRMETWGQAQEALDDFLNDPHNPVMQKSIKKLALASGYFSVWMTVFNNWPAMKTIFINAFAGTRESECFDLTTARYITPAPNPDKLESGGKV